MCIGEIALIAIPLLIARVISCFFIGISAAAIFDAAVCTTYGLQLLYVSSCLRGCAEHYSIARIACAYFVSAAAYLTIAVFYQIPLLLALTQLHLLVWIHTAGIGAMQQVLRRITSDAYTTFLMVLVYLLFLYTNWYDYLLYQQHPTPSGACLLLCMALFFIIEIGNLYRI